MFAGTCQQQDGAFPTMQFISTRGRAAALGFSDAVLAGLASDGGLYVPQSWPQLSAAEIAGFANKPYASVAFDIISRFVDGEIPDAALKTIIEEAYATQEEIARLSGHAVRGFKVGSTSLEAQRILGTSEPGWGLILAPRFGF